MIKPVMKKTHGFYFGKREKCKYKKIHKWTILRLDIKRIIYMFHYIQHSQGWLVIGYIGCLWQHLHSYVDKTNKNVTYDREGDFENIFF